MTEGSYPKGLPHLRLLESCSTTGLASTTESDFLKLCRLQVGDPTAAGRGSGEGLLSGWKVAVSSLGSPRGFPGAQTKGQKGTSSLFLFPEVTNLTLRILSHELMQFLFAFQGQTSNAIALWLRNST